ncbi:AT-hook DNA-binding motif-containing protein 1-like [Salvelinus namaycush]|uniref:AT-hook DNA-binding motif-containing protein 1-like n=1 Tax=Salvelinus namaycush TaxID=8040 RepID=A0A8U0PPE0_SALNM|nr:AT-hook DNA-binding motif-containing protein 1-like [Salvelinus namaycush]
MQIYTDLQMHTPADTHTHLAANTHMDAHTHSDSAGPEQPRTVSSPETHTRSPQRQVLLPVTHPACINQQVASSPCSPPPPPSANRDRPPAISPAQIGPTPLDLSKPSRAIGPNPTGPSLIGPSGSDPSTIGPAPVDPSPVSVEGERKYALRSSGRPRFPCQLRKSSRIRRSTEEGERRGVRESEREEEMAEEEEEEEKERVSVHVKVERPTVEECLPATSKPADSAVPVAPHPSPHPSTRPSPRPTPHPTSHSAPRPAPKPRTSTKPQPRPSTNAKPKAQPRPSIKASPKSSPRPANNHRPATNLSPCPSTNTVPQPTVKKEVPDDLVPKQKRRFVGVRRIVVKVARIPVNLSRRQKSYKISSMETVVGPERGGASGEGGLEGAEGVREPTALLRMKNNGKNVMVMFPPGELPVILKRRRGRPPKQVVPGMPDKTGGNSAAASGNGEPKKPRRRRRAKLPSPQPSYVNDTNDVKTEYGDVLSKLAFLNHQPPATGRCSPPRCWTPSEPDSFHTPSNNPGISALLHRLTGFRRRGGRGGGVGGRGGGAGGAGCEGFKSSFSDFFETIGKKRKVTPALSEPGLPKKRGKGGGGRGGGVAGGEMGVGGEGWKPVRKRRSCKNGVLKGEAGQLEQDWSNGGGVWGEEGGGERERGPGAYQACGSLRGDFPPCEGGRGGAYGSPGGSRGGGGGDEVQGLFAGYFRSLLDSDDSSDLLDISSSRPDPGKLPPTPGYDSSSTGPGPGPRWSPAFPKRSPKGEARENQTQVSSSSSSRPPYSYYLSQNSPTTSSFPKSTPPSLSLPRSPSSPHPSSYGHYPSGYSSSSPAGGSAAPQRPTDCSFAAYGAAGLDKASTAPPVGQGQMGYSNFSKRGYGSYPGQVGPSSPGGGGYMAMAKNNPFPSSSSPEGYRHYLSNQWNCKQGSSGWAWDSLAHHYPGGYSDYVTPGPSEPKDILDISNYTPQKAKRQPFLENLSESSSDSSHLGCTGSGGGVSTGGGGGGSGSGSGGGAYRQGGGRESLPIGGEGGQGQSSLSSLEKLMMDWHESASGPSYNWSQNVLFQGQGKPGRGRRKRNAAEPQIEKEGGGGPGPEPTPDSPTSPPVQTQSHTSTQGSGAKRSGMGGRQGRGARGGRGRLCPSPRERPPGGKKGKAAGGGDGGGGGTAQGGLFQEGLDYFSGDSSSLSPLPALHLGYPPEPCEYPSPSPYSAHPSTPTSEERYPALFPGEASSSSLSPGMTSTSSSYPPKPSPAPQPYHPPLTPAPPPSSFSPSCSQSPRLLPHCGTALSPPYRNPRGIAQWQHQPSH